MERQANNMDKRRPTISLGMIAKDEVGDFRRILATYAPHFDEVVVAVDEKIDEFNEIAKPYGSKVRVIPYKWCDDFSHKRNFVASEIRTHYYFRIDMDDEIVNPDIIKESLTYAYDNDISIVYSYYIYSKDEWGNCNAAHYRETIIKNSTNLFWNKPIHENLLPRSKSGYKIYIDEKLDINHRITHEHSIESAKRNIKYLIAEYNRDKEKTDLRTMAYLGRMLLSIGEWDKALFFLEKHISGSGWDEDRYTSWCQIADIFKLQKKYKEATGAAFEALQEKPDFPDAYLKLHDIYFDQEQWGKAIEWGKLGLAKPIPKTFSLMDPSSHSWRPALSMALSYFKIGDYEKAKQFFDVAKKKVPSLAFVTENEELFDTALGHKRYLEHFMWLTSYMREKNPSLLKHLLYSVPPDIAEHEFVIKMKHIHCDKKTWDKNSIVIFCGSTTEEWSPHSVSTGIGGSEEAVIYLSREFVKLGYDVTVYNNCGEEEGDYDGVHYVNWYKFNTGDNFNILISWRNNIFMMNASARRQLIWVHDLPHNMVFDDDSMVTFDKIIMLSEYHKSLLPKKVQDSGKVYISTNGLNTTDFKPLHGVSRQRSRVIYASSYNRGLETILRGWKEIREAVPDATIHIYYGWEVYDQYIRKGYIKDDGFKTKMLELFKQDGVYEHGRVGHLDLLQEYAKSSVYAYPCTYSGEINCIAYTKAVACGCVPVTNKFAVMGERNPDAVSDKNFISSLIEVLKSDIRGEVNNEYIQKNSWEAIAKDWDANLFPVDIPTVAENRQIWIREQCGKDDKIVDIGCAEGHIFSSWDRDNITPVDVDDHSYLPHFVSADAADLPFEDGKFDVSVLCEILEHVKDPVKVIKEAVRVGGKAVITVPYEHEWRESCDPFMKIEDKEKAYNMSREDFLTTEGKIPLNDFNKDDKYEHLWHHRFYTPETLAQDIEKAGCKGEIIKIRYGRWSHLGVVVTNG